MTFSIRKTCRLSVAAGAAAAFFTVATPPAMAEIAVSEIVLTSGVADREPVDTVTSFAAADGKAFIFARIKNTEAPARLTFVWYLDDVERARVPMKIGTSSRWRTWSSSNIGPGNWRVDLVDETGAVLAQKSFTVGMYAEGGSPAASPATSPSIAETPPKESMGGATSQ